MGKNIIAQARGRGGPTYRAHSFRFKGRIKHKSSLNNATKGNVIDLLHCRGHSCPLACVRFEDEITLLPAPEGIKVGDEVTASDDAPLKAGNTLPLKSLPEGTLIYNIEAVPGDGGKFVRASGTFGKITSKSGNNVMIKLPSKKNKRFNSNCRAVVGVIAGGGRTEKPLMKAGSAYFKMKAKNKLWPRASGSAMNAVDHPFGNKRTSRKSTAKPTSRNAPPGRKVGSIAAKRTGHKR